MCGPQGSYYYLMYTPKASPSSSHTHHYQTDTLCIRINFRCVYLCMCVGVVSFSTALFPGHSMFSMLTLQCYQKFGFCPNIQIIQCENYLIQIILAVFSYKANIFARIFFINLRISGHKMLAALTLKPTAVLNWIQRMIQFHVRNLHSTNSHNVYLWRNWRSLPEKHVFQIEIIFSIRCIRLSMVLPHIHMSTHLNY